MFREIIGWSGDMARRVGRALVDLFFPVSCLECGADGAMLCPKCLERVPLSNAPLTAEGGLDGVITAAADYAQVERYVTLFKYDFVTELRLPLAALMTTRLRVLPFNDPAVLVPVPLHARRLRERGFNQSELLASAVGSDMDWPVVEALSRLRRTRPQVGLGREARLKNVSEAFVLRPGYAKAIAGRQVMLVDDVYTTGATMGECAKILRLAGASRVYGLVLAKG